MPFERFWVVGEESVDQTKELHHSLVLPQVFVTLQEEHKLPAIAPWKGREVGRKESEGEDVSVRCFSVLKSHPQSARSKLCVTCTLPKSQLHIPHTHPHTPHPHIPTPSHPHTLTFPHPHTLTPSHPHIPTPSHPHTLTPSHPHTLTPSP